MIGTPISQYCIFHCNCFKSTDPSKLPKHKCGHDTWCCCRTSKVYAEGITIGM